MRPTGPQGGVPREGQAVHLEDAQHPLGIDGRLALRAKLPVQEGCQTPIAIARALVDELAQERQEGSVLGLGVGTTNPRSLPEALYEIGAGHAQRIGDGLHREPPS